jgi:cyanate permease
MSGMIYFFLFAALLMGVYIAMRRRLAPVKVLAAVGVFGGIVTMTLFALNQNVIWIHALLVGILLGGGMSMAVIFMANYFSNQELRSGSKRSA